jgi:hypothetical protein
MCSQLFGHLGDLHGQRVDHALRTDQCFAESLVLNGQLQRRQRKRVRRHRIARLRHGCRHPRLSLERDTGPQHALVQRRPLHADGRRRGVDIPVVLRQQRNQRLTARDRRRHQGSTHRMSTDRPSGTTPRVIGANQRSTSAVHAPSQSMTAAAFACTRPSRNAPTFIDHRPRCGTRNVARCTDSGDWSSNVIATSTRNVRASGLTPKIHAS